MSLFRSGLVIAIYTLLSRIFGLFRELFIAYNFGTESNADCVNVAFKLPNLFRRIFAEGALSNVFIPLFNEKLVKSLKSAQDFSNEIFTYLVIIVTTLTIIMQLTMPYLMWIIAPGFYLDPDKFVLTTLLCQITMPYLIFISLAAFIGGILNSFSKFAAFAFVPVLFNIIIIGGTLVFEQFTNKNIAISSSVIFGGILQLVFMQFALKQIRFKISFRFLKPGNTIKKFFANMIPAIMSSSIVQLNIFVSQSIASFIPGTISILSYADRIYQFPLSIIGITFATILLPKLSQIYKSNDLTQIYLVQNNSIKLALFFSLPSSLGIICLARPIIHLIYERGLFHEYDTINTSNALAIFALGLPAHILIKILSTIFYANDNYKLPLKISNYLLILSIISNIIFIIPFKHVGIALSSTFTCWSGLWLLYTQARSLNYLVIDKNLLSYLIRLLICCAGMLVFIVIIKNYYNDWFFQKIIWKKV